MRQGKKVTVQPASDGTVTKDDVSPKDSDGRIADDEKKG